MEEVRKIPEWKNLYDAALEWHYGSVHSFDEISMILGIKASDRKFRTAISRAVAELTLVGKHLVNVRGVGYEVIEHERYMEEANKQVVRGMRSFGRGLKIISSCKLELVSSHRRQQTIAFKDWLRSKVSEDTPKVMDWSVIARSSDKISMIPTRRN